MKSFLSVEVENFKKMTGSRTDCVGCREVPPATQARDPFAEHGVRFCLLCCQPKPFPLSLSARTLEPTLRHPCRPRPRNGTSYQRTHCRFATGTPTLHRSARTCVTGLRYKPQLPKLGRLGSSKRNYVNQPYGFWQVELFC